jgi:hypothetical protein
MLPGSSKSTDGLDKLTWKRLQSKLPRTLLREDPHLLGQLGVRKASSLSATLPAHRHAPELDGQRNAGAFP